MEQRVGHIDPGETRLIERHNLRSVRAQTVVAIRQHDAGQHKEESHRAGAVEEKTPEQRRRREGRAILDMQHDDPKRSGEAENGERIQMRFGRPDGSGRRNLGGAVQPGRRAGVARACSSAIPASEAGSAAWFSANSRMGRPCRADPRPEDRDVTDSGGRRARPLANAGASACWRHVC